MNVGVTSYVFVLPHTHFQKNIELEFYTHFTLGSYFLNWHKITTVVEIIQKIKA